MSARAARRFGLLPPLVLVLAAAWAGGGESDPAPKYTGPKVLLKQYTPPGRYTMTLSQETSRTVTLEAGPKTSGRGTSTYVIGAEVRPADEAGERAVRLTWRRIRYTESSPGAPPEVYDSADPAGQPPIAVKAMYDAILKTEMRAVLGAHDDLLRVDGAEVFENAGDPGAPPTPETMGRMFCVCTAGTAVGVWPVVQSGRPVGPGDTWEFFTRFRGAQSESGKWPVTCRLLDIEQTPSGRVAVIEWKGRLLKDNPALRPGLNFRHFDEQLSGRQRFNVDSGLVEWQTLETDSVLGVVLLPPEGGQVPGTCRAKHSQTRTFSPDAGATPAPAP